MLKKYSLGSIEFEVPASWRVSDFGSSIEIVDDQACGALHLSFLKRTKADNPKGLDAKLLIENFALNNNLVSENSVATSEEIWEAKAIGSFSPDKPTDQMPKHWLLGCVVWSDKAVRASYCTDSRGEHIKVAATIIDSIGRKDL